MNPTVPQKSLGRRATQAFTRLLITLLVLGLGGAVVFLLSQLNARTFSLALEDGTLVVMKGRMLPVGSAPYRPGEARLADAYAPIPTEGKDVSSLLQQRFGDRDELDRALFPLLTSLARPRIETDDPARLERGLYYLRRAEMLSGLTAEQNRTLEGMKAEIAFYQARQKLEEARRAVVLALEQLKLAANSRNQHTRSANQWLNKVGPAAEQLEEALRTVADSPTEPGDTSPETTPPPPASEAQPPKAQQPPAAPGSPSPDGQTQRGPTQPAQPGTEAMH